MRLRVTRATPTLSSSKPLGAGRPAWAGLQAKMTLSSPGDRYEREADRLAEAVVGASEPASGQRGTLVQRQVAEKVTPEEEEEDLSVEATPENVREMEESNVARFAQRKAENGAGAAEVGGSGALQAALVYRRQGAALDAPTRIAMESHFGHDFSRVRVHTDRRAHRAARAIQARAFTIGQDIWFSRGAFSPGSRAGRHLLAHELVHTLQQRDRSTGPEGLDIQRAICPGACERPVRRGRLCRAREVNRDNCGERGASDDANKISHIRVQLDRRKVRLFWNGEPETNQGREEEIDCTPNAAETPRGLHTVGRRCGVNHTSRKRYNMAWFTEIKNTSEIEGRDLPRMMYGFHDSQPIGRRRRSGRPYTSAGCVRVSCENARKINENTVSNWTSIRIGAGGGEERSGERPRTYRIQRDETLSEIASRFGVSVERLAEVNDISDPDRIRAGQTLRIPAE